MSVKCRMQGRGRDGPFGPPPARIRTEELIRLRPRVEDDRRLLASSDTTSLPLVHRRIRVPHFPGTASGASNARAAFPLVGPLRSTDSAAAFSPGLVRPLLQCYGIALPKADLENVPEALVPQSKDSRPRPLRIADRAVERGDFRNQARRRAGSFPQRVDDCRGILPRHKAAGGEPSEGCPLGVP